MKKENGRVINNTVMLYIISIVKLILPLVTLPYLTRILSEDAYGFVAYVKSCMTYIQLIIDFGFILSAVKDIVKANQDKDKINNVIGNTIIAKCMLAIASAIAIVIMIACMPILQMNVLYVALSFIAIALTILFEDFFFRGVEKMQFITIIFLISKGISTALTFILVKDDSTLIFVPILEITSSFIASAISTCLLYKKGYKIKPSCFRDILKSIKESFIYFLSTVATTAFSALNTLVIGMYITDLSEVARWSVCMSMITAIQGLYSPICNGIYPHMIKEKKLGYIHRVMLIFMPIVTAGCVFSYFFAPTALQIFGGEKYVDGAGIFRWMIPILFFSFPAQVYGWPTLGAIGKEKETTISTTITAVVQIGGMFLLIPTGQFTLVNLAILRFSTEALLMGIRMFFVYKNRRCFSPYCDQLEVKNEQD